MHSLTNKNIIIFFLLIGIIISLCLIPANAKTTEEIYQEKLDKLKPDDADGHYQLGLWCLKNKLDEQAKIEFNKVIELNPKHEGARKNLGHVKYKDKWQTPNEMTAQGLVNYKGKWMPLDESMKAQGYVKFEDQWVTPKEEKFIKELIKKLGSYKGVLDNPGADSEDLPWEKARDKETEYFVVKTNLSVDALNDICIILEYAYFYYQDLFGCEQPKGQKLRVMVAKNIDEFKKLYYDLTGKNPPTGWMGGFIPASTPYNKSKQSCLLVSYNLPKGNEVPGNLLHECTHFAMELVRQKYDFPQPPVWLNEGWATYCEGSRLEGKRLVTNCINQGYFPLIKDVIRQHTYIELKGFINLTQTEYNSDSYYQEGWSLIYFFINGQGGKYKSGLQAYMEAWKKGKIIIGGAGTGNYYPQDKPAHLKLFEQCMGVSIDQLEKEWKEYILSLQ